MSATAQAAHDRPSKQDVAAALRAFFRIAEIWKLPPEQQMTLLGQESKSTYYLWRKNQTGSLSRDTVERLSYVIGIYKALQILLPEQSLADDWLHRPSSAAPFRGRAPLDRLLSGNMSDLYVIRQYLDAERGG